MSIVQIRQDVYLCGDKFPSLICFPIAAQFLSDDVIALLQFEETQNDLGIAAERHYRLVRPEEVTAADIAAYRSSLR